MVNEVLRCCWGERREMGYEFLRIEEDFWGKGLVIVE